MSEIVTDADQSRRPHGRARGAGEPRFGRGDFWNSACGARRADTPLPAAIPLLLQPDRARPCRRQLATAEWKVLTELAEIGVLRSRLGGEPTARKDLVELVRHATDVGLYSNLVTSAVLLTRKDCASRCRPLPRQISFQGNEPAVADHVASRIRTRKTRSRQMDARTGPAADRQRGYAPAKSPSIVRHHQMAVDLDADRLESPMCNITAGR